ncbi:glycosyltransferase [bacterium]|nr:glycosyltransferase [bacterium]
MKVLIFENSSRDMIISRVPYALFLKKKEVQVFLCCNYDEDLVQICKKNDFGYVFCNNLKSINFITFFKNIFKISSFVKKRNIDIIHSFRFHPNLITFFVKLLCNCHVINHVTGLGVYFIRKDVKSKLIKLFTKILYLVNKNFLATTIVVQNKFDGKDLKINCELIRGSGIDELNFNTKVLVKKELKLKYKKNNFIYLIACRLLVTKGILELSKAFDYIYSTSKKNSILIIAGVPDYSNPDSISEEQLEYLRNQKNVHVLGHVKNINEYIQLSDCCIYPSIYREGVPRFLIESISMGKPIITTNTIGNRDAFFNNGILMSSNKSNEIIKAMKRLERSNLRQFSKESLNHYNKYFSQKIVYNQNLDLYYNLNDRKLT